MVWQPERWPRWVDRSAAIVFLESLQGSLYAMAAHAQAAPHGGHARLSTIGGSSVTVRTEFHATPVQNLIAGEWLGGASVTVNRNPSDVGDVIGEYAQADRAQARAAIGAAKQAFPGWATGSIQERANILDRAGTEIVARKDELGRLLSREEGKTLPEGIGEAMRAGQIFKFFAGEVVRQTGEHAAVGAAGRRSRGHARAASASSD